MTDWHELARKYNTDPDTLDPDTRAWTDTARAELDRRRAAGHVAPEGKQNFPIGLDDDLNPFPVDET